MPRVNRAGTPADPRPADERILSTTIDALSRLDPAALTIQQICRNAGVTAPTIYYHFGNKDGLLAAAVERLVRDWVDLMDAGVPRRGDLEETLEIAIQGWESMICSTTRPLAVFAWVTLMSAETSQQSRQALVRARDRSQQLVREALVPHLGDNDLATGLSMVTVDTLIAAALQHHLDRDPAELRRRLTALTALIRAAAETPVDSTQGWDTPGLRRGRDSSVLS